MDTPFLCIYRTFTYLYLTILTIYYPFNTKVLNLCISFFSCFLLLQTTQDLRQQLLKDGYRLDEVPDDEELDLIPPRPMNERCVCCQPQSNCVVQWDRLLLYVRPGPVYTLFASSANFASVKEIWGRWKVMKMWNSLQGVPKMKSLKIFPTNFCQTLVSKWTIFRSQCSNLMK